KELQYTEKWEEAEVGLGREGFAELFTYIRMIYCKEKARRSILADFRDHVTSKTNAVDLVDRVILPYGEALEDILASAFEASSNADKVNLSLRWLNMIDNSDWIPPAILFLAKNRPSSDKIAEFFAELDRLASGLMILRSNINERIERYAAVLAEIEAGKDFKAAGSSMQLRKEEKENILRILDGDLYLGIKTRLYVLLRLDNSLSGGGAQYQHGIITIEHVLPQSPAMGSKWVQWFPSESDRTSRVHKMGNLALLTRRKNSSAQNYDFDQKKTKYFSVGGISPFVLTTQVLGEPTWGPEVIDRRQKDLVAKLAKLWRLD
ncbi:MAG: HNH endonuclease, partial [Candidatus Sericytochromatia bacterium]|nr:HNH endonuclease [Candidatus Tanganyikabacteria bacterium]